MRSGITLGHTISGLTANGFTAVAIIMTLALPLQGCGRKAPLTLPTSKARGATGQTPQGTASQIPAPQAPALQTPATNLHTPEPQKTAEPIKLQGNEP